MAEVDGYWGEGYYGEGYWGEGYWGEYGSVVEEDVPSPTDPQELREESHEACSRITPFHLEGETDGGS